MSWQSKTVLVTGADGFVGSHLAERLVREGARVRAMVLYNSLGRHGWLDDSELQSEMEIVAGDVCDRDCVTAVMRNVDLVFHLAALIAIPYSYQAPSSYVRTNVEGTLNVLQAARSAGVKRFLHTSTSEVYGTARYVPIDEQHPLQGQSPYAASKIGADKIAESFYRAFDLPVVTVRPFNTYGPRQSARAVIPTIITQALTKKEVRLGNVTPMRDFTYVTDTVEGFLRLANAANVLGQEFNLGTGTSISVGDLARKIFTLLGTSPAIVADKQRHRPDGSEVMRLESCIQKMQAATGWRPCVSLDDGLQRTIEWIRSHLEAYQPDHYSV